MITDDKIIKIFCDVDDSCKEFVRMRVGRPQLAAPGTRRGSRIPSLSEREIITIALLFHFGTYRNFKEYYLNFIRGEKHGFFPAAVSYNRFLELLPRVLVPLARFLGTRALGACTGIAYADSTMIPVCHNARRYSNRVFAGAATDGRDSMGWTHGFKLHLLCNDRGEIVRFALTGANARDLDPGVWALFARGLRGHVFADRGYIFAGLSQRLRAQGVRLVTGVCRNMKNRLLPLWEKEMLRKRAIIETINDLLKNTAQIAHTRHRSAGNFTINLLSALGAYCYFDNKPKATAHHPLETGEERPRFAIILFRTQVGYSKIFVVAE